MLTDKEIRYVRHQLLFGVKDPNRRSKILFVADALAREADPDDDYNDIYWSIVGYFLDPENTDDLERDFAELGGNLSIPPFDSGYNEIPPAIVDKPQLIIKLPKR